MRKPTKPTKCPRTTPLTPRDLARVTGGKEDAGIHARPTGGGGHQPIKT